MIILFFNLLGHPKDRQTDRPNGRRRARITITQVCVLYEGH